MDKYGKTSKVIKIQMIGGEFLIFTIDPNAIKVKIYL